jgi:hypothetical protein
MQRPQDELLTSFQTCEKFTRSKEASMTESGMFNLLSAAGIQVRDFAKDITTSAPANCPFLGQKL